MRPSLPPACIPFICAIKLFLSPHAGPSLLTNWEEGHGSRAGRGARAIPDMVVGPRPLASGFRHPVLSHGFWD